MCLFAFWCTELCIGAQVLDQKYTLDVNEAARHERLNPVLLKKVLSLTLSNSVACRWVAGSIWCAHTLLSGLCDTHATADLESSVPNPPKPSSSIPMLSSAMLLTISCFRQHVKLTVQVILNHLYREGLFDVAGTLAEEAGLPEDAAQEAKEKFSEMHRHLELVRCQL